MELNSAQIDHFQQQGFVLVPNPLDIAAVENLARRQQEVEPQWRQTQWPPQYNTMACQFFMVGEPLLQLAEMPQLVEMARCLLATPQVHIGACGIGAAAQIVSADGRPRHQVHWHADGGPDVAQVAVRIALDPHHQSNGPLRILPGSHRRQQEEVEEELRQLELASGCHEQAPDLCFARHPAEVAVHLDPRWALVWTPSCWHATAEKKAAGPRRAFSFNYFPAGGRRRDSEALKHVFSDQWQGWSRTRKELWGLGDDH